MKAANILAGLAAVLWFALALLGREGVNGIVAQNAPGYPNMGQINLYIVYPLYVVLVLISCAGVCNAFRRWPSVLGLASGASMLAILPYLAVWGGGV